MKIKKSNGWIAVSVVVLMVLGAGWVFGKKTKISGENAEFLSKVRYVISKDERKFFRNLPDEKRGEFIRKFWEVRDPDPNTTVNEFKQDYFSRIDEANRLFRGGRDGWLTDRGMTFVLLGPPLHVSEYPLGSVGGSGRPYLIWHYSEMAVLFVDVHGDGDYQVDYAGLGHHADVQHAFVKAKSEYKYMEDLFHYDFKYNKKDNARSLVFSILTEELDFKEEEGGNKMLTLLEITVNAKDRRYNDVWTYQKTHRVAFAEGDTVPKKIEINVPLEIKKGKYFFFTSVKKMDDRSSDRTFNNKLLKVK